MNAVPSGSYGDEVLAAATGVRGDVLAEKLLVIDPSSEALEDARIADLPRFLRAGDLLVVNDAATLPASLSAKGPAGEAMELRLAHHHDDGAWDVVLFGDGDWRTRTEHRAPPPVLSPGEVLTCAGDLRAVVEARSDRSARLVTVRFSHEGDAFWRRLYAIGRPVQYAHLRDELALWDVQTPFASRPWSLEMPSAGRPLSWALVQALRESGVELAAITHAAGLSSTGDEVLDAAMPWPERSDIPQATVDAVARCRARRGRVIAVGTSVVRALEGRADASQGVLSAGTAMTALVLGEGTTPRVVDGIFTGMHEPGTSHFALLTAFASAPLLHASLRFAAGRGYLQHEFGDSALVLAR